MKNEMGSPMAATQLVTLKEVENLLKVSRTTLWKLRDSDGFPVPVRLCSRVHYRYDDIERYVASKAA